MDVGKCVDICYSWVSGFAGLQVGIKDAERIGIEGEREREGGGMERKREREVRKGRKGN